MGFFAYRRILCVGVLEHMQHVMVLFQRGGHLSRSRRRFEVFQFHTALPIALMAAV